MQGPAEEKWGYTNVSVADWDLDGKLDILVNDITGAVVWYRNIGTAREPERRLPRRWKWNGSARHPDPDWVWWQPKGKQLVTQWRTTPAVVDWDHDGLPDLVMMDYRGYVCLFRRQRRNGKLVLLAPELIFVDHTGRFLNLSAGRGGASGRRKLNVVDWNGDGKLDLVTDGPDGPVWYENTGTQQKPVMQLRGNVLKTKIQGHNPTPYVIDWNSDGKPDMIVGTQDGFFITSSGLLSMPRHTDVGFRLLVFAALAAFSLNSQTLRQEADRLGVKISGAVNPGKFTEPAYAQAVAREFNMIEPENVMKFGPIHPDRERYDFSGGDKIVEFANKNGMAVRGHTLVWHSQVAPWVKSRGFSPN